ncbi:MAG: acetolactate synthase, large subunit, biosynthetic type [Deltaproteobacteria bacterium CG_4_9_14_3_um_filter_44_9]|nr:MAG: acetolactate synthase, large subunit, biosynthetic type [Deltaproteobacteria bacterium CG2_30_43_15]PIU84996.1 MAG: acetolactate synthase, large subunit, biosynthetic type [Deltaproteobacteria bacterium CG06_land_8_20_14_3_00_44_19]PIX24162.1 MAG: acetolactate synthase, large subunit, biosynthetic type [Deltaproteobacteria bacterium CG_4_8_14_3_um_filter_43_13]PIZ20719.1 MAG: acetolactate synthase, large subunit, biosynthetic type [Deltaproteobacteria bacterium CG_4_10_14_0_8_um_filter_4
MKKTGAQILLESLQLEGVDTIFGFPGGAVIGIYDALLNSPIRHILVRHEQAAVHAADGYARSSGKVGVCLVTSGPGATNTVTGIATAYMDSIPVVVLTGQVSTGLIGNDAFQEADIMGITRPCTKHSYLVKDVKELARTIKEAFYIAGTGRPGPVLVDLPKDVIADSAEFNYPESVNMQSYNPTYRGHRGQIQKAFKLILKANRPLIYAGGGVISSDASEELTAFARTLSIPVTATLMGLGCFPGVDDLSLGMLGMHGTYRANMAVTNCDLLIAVGARFDDRVTGKIDGFAPNAKIIHIDIDPTSISKNIRVHIPIVGDAKDVLKKINKLIQEEKEDWTSIRREWLDQILKWKNTYPLAYEQKDVIKPQYVVEKIYEITKGDAIISTEVGQNQMWTAQYYHFTKPRTLLTSGGLGTMGYGFPAAIGAQIAFPEKTVIDIAGDGSIQMNIQELATVAQYNLPVKIAILNNRYLGMVRQWQGLFHNKRYSQTPLEVSPDFIKLAEAYGAVGLRATKPEEVVPTIEKALSISKAVIMDFVVEREEDVYPMVPVGAPLKEMLLV